MFYTPENSRIQETTDVPRLIEGGEDWSDPTHYPHSLFEFMTQFGSTKGIGCDLFTLLDVNG